MTWADDINGAWAAMLRPDPALVAEARRIFPDPVPASIKYGEHRWGAFATKENP
jgi:hypothetical protein